VRPGQRGIHRQDRELQDGRHLDGQRHWLFLAELIGPVRDDVVGRLREASSTPFAIGDRDPGGRDDLVDGLLADGACCNDGALITPR